MKPRISTDVWELLKNLGDKDKLRYLFLYTHASSAGIIRRDLKFMLNFPVSSFLTRINNYQELIRKVKGGHLFIPHFLIYNYSKLQTSSKLHQGIIKELKSYGIEHDLPVVKKKRRQTVIKMYGEFSMYQVECIYTKEMRIELARLFPGVDYKEQIKYNIEGWKERYPLKWEKKIKTRHNWQKFMHNWFRKEYDKIKKPKTLTNEGFIN